MRGAIKKGYGKTAIGVVIVAIILFPVYWMVLTSLRTDAEVARTPPQLLPTGIDFSAYRIVQEALTNTLKHGHAATARVELRVGEHVLDVEIVDDGTGSSSPGRGHGLIGMRERAAVLGGELDEISSALQDAEKRRRLEEQAVG